MNLMNCKVPWLSTRQLLLCIAFVAALQVFRVANDFSASRSNTAKLDDAAQYSTSWFQWQNALGGVRLVDENASRSVFRNTQINGNNNIINNYNHNNYNIIHPAPLLADHRTLLFHFVWTTNSSFSDTLYRVSIESVLRAHPRATVTLWSNTLTAADARQLLASIGQCYRVHVARYELAALSRGTPLAALVQRLQSRERSAQAQKYWYSNESNLLRLLLLYHFGGVYCDTDMVIMRAIDVFGANFVAFQNSRDTMLNGAVLGAAKRSPFLVELMDEMTASYNGERWGMNGPKLLTRVHDRHNWTCAVRFLQHATFYPYHFQRADLEPCFTDTSENATFVRQNISAHAYGVHLNSRFTFEWMRMQTPIAKGSVCDWLLHSFRLPPCGP